MSLTINAGGTGRVLFPHGLPHAGPQGLEESLPRAIDPPVTERGVDGGPLGEIMGQHPPRAAAAVDVEDAIDDVAHDHLAWPPAWLGRRDQRLKDGIRFVGQVAEVGSVFHPNNLQKVTLFAQTLTPGRRSRSRVAGIVL